MCKSKILVACGKKATALTMRPNSKSPNKDIEDWTTNEKFNLYQGLKAGGSHDIDKICTFIPTKSKAQIEKAVAYYKKIAFRHPDVADRKKKNLTSNLPRVPLVCWAKQLTDSCSFEHLQTDIVNTLRLIAEFEIIPPEICTERVDFRQIYHTIANAMEGKSLEHDPTAAIIFDKCFVEGVLVSKGFMKNSSFVRIMESYLQSDHEDDTLTEDSNILTKPTNDHEVAALLHLISEKNYNPFCISLSHLKLQ